MANYYKTIYRIMEHNHGNNNNTIQCQLLHISLWNSLCRSIFRYINVTNNLSEKPSPYDDDFSLLYSILVLPFR